MNDAGGIMNIAKNEIENKLERPIVTSENYFDLTDNKQYQITKE